MAPAHSAQPNPKLKFSKLGTAEFSVIFGSAVRPLPCEAHRKPARLPPVGSVVNHPTDQRVFKTDVPTGFFRLDPLVPQNLLPLREELAVKGRTLKQIVVGGCAG